VPEILERSIQGLFTGSLLNRPYTSQVWNSAAADRIFSHFVICLFEGEKFGIRHFGVG
jgi:hypothetical protein